MNLVRSDREVALNELFVACQEVADSHRHAVSLLHDPKLGRVLTALADRVVAIAAKLEALVRALGDLPSTPDKDKEDLEQLVHQASAAISANEVQTVLRQRLQAEEELQQLAQHTQQQDLTQAEGEVIGELLDHSDQALRLLQQATSEDS